MDGVNAVALAALGVQVVVCGLVAPAIEFSPVARRWAEVGEYVSIGLSANAFPETDVPQQRIVINEGRMTT